MANAEPWEAYVDYVHKIARDGLAKLNENPEVKDAINAGVGGDGQKLIGPIIDSVFDVGKEAAHLGQVSQSASLFLCCILFGSHVGSWFTRLFSFMR